MTLGIAHAMPSEASKSLIAIYLDTSKLAACFMTWKM